MPKTDVDYSNTIIYKIYCKDKTITDVYIGHTTNFIQRKYLHKSSCNNLNNTLKIYNVIRSNGGWENWDMIEIAKYNCKDATEARIKEQEHYNELNSSLNSCPPYVDKSKYFCTTCNLQFFGSKQYAKHINGIKHTKNMSNINPNENAIIQQRDTLVAKNNIKNYYCEKCDYTCCKKYNWEKHLLTAKHLNENEGDNSVAINGKKWQQETFKCEFCNKEYQHRQNLWRHNKKCTKNDEPSDKQLILQILKQNSELIKENSELRKEQTDIKELILEIVKNGTHNTTNNTTTHTNSHNKAFNLNFFLNETCKNAMNITDFVDSIKLQLSDLMEVGEIGYVEGMSKIIVKNLNSLDETVRPIHCTDKKRETMYIKDEGQWEKEDDNKTRLKKAINKVANKNIKLLPQFREKYPEYKNSSSKISDIHDKLVIEVMETDDDKKGKIIKNISKATTIKENY